MTLLTMYITSSTAEVMCGGLEVSGLCRLRFRSGGCSSSWKAFSTDRRKKKVVIELKGEINRSATFLLKLEFTSRDGRERRSCSFVVASPLSACCNT